MRSRNPDEPLPVSRPKRRLYRGLLFASAGVAGMLVVLGVGAALVLRAPGVQRQVIEGISESVESSYGFSIDAESFRASLLRGRLEVRRLRLQVGESDPFALVEAVRVRFRPMSLVRGPLRLVAVELERPEVDGDATFPQSNEPDDAAPLESIALVVESLRISDGRVFGSAAGGATVDIRDWSLGGLEIDGRFDGRKLDVTSLETDLLLGRENADPIELTVDASAALELPGSAMIERLSIVGDELSAEVSVKTDGDWQESSGRLRLEADLGSLLGRGPSPPLLVEGEVDFAAWRGSLYVKAEDQPAALLSDLEVLSGDLAGDLELGDTRLDLDFEVKLETSAPASRTAAGELVAVARRESVPVIELEARPRVELAQADSLEALTKSRARIDADLVLLPRLEGARRVSARLFGAEVADVASWSIERGEALIEQPSVERLLAAAARLWPALLSPSALESLPPLGRLAADASFAGPLSDPATEVRARLRQGANERIEVTAAGRPLASDWNVAAEGMNLDLGRFASAMSGRVDFSGRVDDLLGAGTGSLQVSGRDIATVSNPIFSTAALRVEGTKRSLDWRGNGVLARGGAVRGEGVVRPEQPRRFADGGFTWETGDPRLPSIDASFALEDGGLRVAALGAAGSSSGGASKDRAPIEASLDLPLAALDALPQLGDLSKLPFERRSGPVRVNWNVPTGEWRDFFPAEWVEALGSLDSLQAGSIGDLTLDLACPACSTGRLSVRDLAVDLGGRSARAFGDLGLEIAEARAVIEPWSIAGDGLELSVSSEAELERSWSFGDSGTDLVAGSRTLVASRVDSAWLESLPLTVVERGTLQFEAEISGALDALIGAGSVSAPGMQFSLDVNPSLVFRDLAADAALAEGYLEWRNATVALQDAVLRGEGRAWIADPLDDASGSLSIASSLPVVTAAELPFRIADGWFTVDGARVTTTGGEGTARLDIPLGDSDAAMASLEWDLPANDWAPLLARVRGTEDPEVIELSSRGRVALPLGWPAAAEALVELGAGRIVVRGRETTIEPKAELRMRDGVAKIAPVSLRTSEQNFLFEAEARASSAWSFGDELSEFLEHFRVVGTGDIDSGLLNPFLAGGRAEGGVAIDFEIEGSPSAFDGRLEASGPDATVLFRSPYLARFESPSFAVSLRDGRVELDRADLRLNEGTLTANGVLSDAGATDLGLEITDSVFRLDYGLVVTVDGDLRYRLGVDGRSAVSGVLDVERGALTRSVQLDLDLLSQLLAPIDLTTTEDDPLDLIDLALEVRTRQGVRVKNNLGDLLARWEPLQVTGTLARPVIEGTLEVDPGGLLYAYGQTVRLDKAVIEYPGEYGVEPRLTFEATTSLEDPTIGQLALSDPFKANSRPGQADDSAAGREVGADLARFYGEQVAGKVGESVGVSVSLRPLLIFGETDPGARLTVSRDLSPNLALAASIDLTGAEDRTYLLELHELRLLPRLVGQAYTDDGEDYGGALLQRQEWGGSRAVEDEDLPRISKIIVTPPKGVSRRGIKRALALDKGELFDPSQKFVAEVELVDYLMRKGYPDADVSLRADADQRRERRVELEVAIEAGPRVEFTFEGEKIPGPLKVLIKSLYRPDFFESESLEEMRAETIRALRSRGFLEPEVEIEVEPLDELGSTTDRRVVVRTRGGVRISSDPPIFEGVSPDDVEVLNVAFANAVQRVELAVGLASADRTLLSTLAGLGYTEARIASRYQSLDERVLTVVIEPGPRERITRVEIEGVVSPEMSDVEEADLIALLAVKAGDPLRRSRLSRSAIAIERYLGKKGYLEARVRTLIEPDSEEPLANAVTFVVEPGGVSVLDDIEFKGLRSTRERFARRVAGLETDESLAREELSRARTALWKTGLFSAVGTEIVPVREGRDRVVFDLEERDRYRLTYGVRWDSNDGLGAVVDATDDNFIGRGWTLGLRLLSSNEEEGVRALTRIPRAFGGPGQLELYAAVREFTETGTVSTGSVDAAVPVEVFESTLQYSQPVTEKTTFRIYGRYTDTTRSLPILPGVFIPVQVRNPQLGLQYVYDSRSSEPIVERGVFASSDLSGSREFLGGDLSYVRSFSQLNFHRRLGKLFGSRLLWSQSYRVGLAEAFDQELTRDVRFFAGGEYSVRGYETDTLGAVEMLNESTTRALGGPALLVINQELRWRLFEDYTVVLFADAGNVWQTIDDFGGDLFTSTGLGLRAVTPAGLLRLDLARPLEGRSGIDPEYKVYFGLGTSF